MERNIERLIAQRFDELAHSAMFPDDLRADDFRLRAVLDWFGNVQAQRILDAGCAKGRFVRALAGLGAAVTGIDPVWKFIRMAAQSAPTASFIVTSITALPLVDQSYDRLLCIEVMEHIPDTERAISEMSRVLKPGGRALILDKNLIGLGVYRCLPNWAYKAIWERRGRWMYEKEFPFQERWFTPWSLRRILQRYFTRVEIRYLDERVTGRWRLVLKPLFKLFPFLRPDVAWCCVK